MLFDLIKQYPTISIIVLIVIIILVAIIVIQGRSIEIPGVKIGNKNPKKLEQAQTQSVQIYTASTFPSELIEEVAQRVLIRVQKIQIETAIEPNLLYNPPNLSSRIIYLHRVRYDFKNKLSDIVVNDGGGWAGISLAGYESFFNKAVSFHLIPDELIAQLNDFNIYTQAYLNSGDISEKVFLEIQYLAVNINKGLDTVIATMPRKYLPYGNALG